MFFLKKEKDSPSPAKGEMIFLFFHPFRKTSYLKTGR
jgi:hypothetical protein